MKVNINQTATVTLNEHGRTILKSYLKETLSILKNADVETRFAALDRYTPNADDTFSAPLWQIIGIFGEYIQMGYELPFLRGEIVIGKMK